MRHWLDVWDGEAAAPREESAWRADRVRYGPKALRRHWSLYAVAVYRFGRWNDERRGSRAGRAFGRNIYLVCHRAIEALLGITLPKEARIGPGLLIHHLGPVVIHPDAVIGANCTLRHGVTVGERVSGLGVPVLGDNVEVGAYAQILGPVSVGNSVKIGAMALVIQDVPDFAKVFAPAALQVPPAKV